MGTEYKRVFSLKLILDIAISEVPKYHRYCHISSVQFSSVARLCPTLCDPMNCGTPGLPVPYHKFSNITDLFSYFSEKEYTPIILG